MPILKSLFLAASLCTSTLVAASTVTYSNSRRMLFDTNGNQIDAYGSKVNVFNETYYLYGNSFSIDGRPSGLKSYSSDDLVNWKYEGFLFDIDDPLASTYCAENGACGRPHIVYNPTSEMYILWTNAGTNGYALATSDVPAGPYTFSDTTAAIDPQFDSLSPADFSVEIIDGKGYLVFSIINFASPDTGSIWPVFYQTLHISELTDDFMNTTRLSYPVISAAADAIDQQTESPDIFKRGDTFYVVASNTCGFCNGTLALLYRSNSIQGPWTRQILSGYGCNGQVEGVLPLIDPSNGEVTNVWHATSVPGGMRTGINGHIFQPLTFYANGSAKDLDCAADAVFTVPFTSGNGTATIGNATSASDKTPPLATYSSVCDSISFLLYQTWTASKSGTLDSVSLNIARGAQTSAITATVFKFGSYTELLTPGFKWTTMGTGSFYPNQTSYTFDSIDIPISSNATVSKGDLLGLSFGADLVYGAEFASWCHLEYETAENSTFKLFQQGGGQYSWRGLQGNTAPVYERVGKSVKMLATYA